VLSDGLRFHYCDENHRIANGAMTRSEESHLDDALARTCVVVPAFNEADVIGDVLARLCTLPCTTVVVDDGSTDGTYDVCRPYPIHLLHHACNLGQGAALQTGMAFALTRLGPRYLVTFDGDGQHQLQDIAALIAALSTGAVDVALGTRFGRAADAALVPRGRRAVLKAAVVFTRFSTGMRVTDAHNGLRAFTARAAARIELRHNGMAHASELLAAIRRERLRWCEVPVSVAYTEYSGRKGQRGVGALDIVWDLVAGRMP